MEVKKKKIVSNSIVLVVIEISVAKVTQEDFTQSCVSVWRVHFSKFLGSSTSLKL